MSILISLLLKNLIAHVLEAFTFRDVLVILDDLFAAKSQARIMQLQYELTTLKKGSESISDHYQKAILLHDTLAATGKTLTSTEFITFLLASLGIDFDSVVTSTTTRVDPLNPAHVYSHLLKYESRLSHHQVTLTASPELSANATFKPHSDPNNRGHGNFHGRDNYRGLGWGRNGVCGCASHFYSSPRRTYQVCLKSGYNTVSYNHRFHYNY